MRREDRALALACLDQPAVLWSVFRAHREDAQTAIRRDRGCACFSGNADRT